MIKKLVRNLPDLFMFGLLSLTFDKLYSSRLISGGESSISKIRLWSYHIDPKLVVFFVRRSSIVYTF